MKIVDILVNKKIIVIILLALFLCGCDFKREEEVTCTASTGELGGDYASSTTSLNYKFEKGELSKIKMTMDVSFNELSTLSPEKKEASIKELLEDYKGFQHIAYSYKKIDDNHYQVLLEVDYKNLSEEELKSFTYTKEQITDIDYLARSYEAQGYKCE